MSASLYVTLSPVKCRESWFLAEHGHCQLDWTWEATPQEGCVHNGMSTCHKPPLLGARKISKWVTNGLYHAAATEYDLHIGLNFIFFNPSRTTKSSYKPIRWSWRLQGLSVQTSPLLSGKQGRALECLLQFFSQQQDQEPYPTLLITVRQEHMMVKNRTLKRLFIQIIWTHKDKPLAEVSVRTRSS